MFNLIARKYPNMLGNIPDKYFIPSKSLAKDSFTLRFFNELDIEEALEEWNVLQATLRQAARNSSTITSASYFQTNSDESTICSKTPTVGFGIYICYFVSAHRQIILQYK